MMLDNQDKKEPLEKRKEILFKGLTQNRTIDGTPRKTEVTKRHELPKKARLSQQGLRYSTFKF